MLKSRVILFAVGLVVGAAITTAVILLRERDDGAPELPPPRPPMPSWSEEAQKIHRCARKACLKKIVRDRERDRQVVRVVEGGVEYYHAACWDDVTGAPKP